MVSRLYLNRDTLASHYRKIEVDCSVVFGNDKEQKHMNEPPPTARWLRPPTSSSKPASLPMRPCRVEEQREERDDSGDGNFTPDSEADHSDTELQSQESTSSEHGEKRILVSKACKLTNHRLVNRRSEGSRIQPRC
ncbi:hypothetical protein GQ600_360 [Phytophthora cactorum]|nr:hypothetical protein GQ600_360 [Phytophthora cactorum]